MNNIEKIYGRVMNLGNMSLDTIVVNGIKSTKNDMRLDSMYYNEFDSSKYSNKSTLDQLTIKNNFYLGLCYKGNDEDGNFVTDEVWMSPMNIETFKDFLKEVYEQISSKAEKIYVRNRIAPEFEDFIIQTGYDENNQGFGPIDSLGHTIYAYPTVIVSTNDEMYNGIGLGIENSDGESVVQELSITTIYAMIMTLENYNLLTDSRLVTLIGMSYQNNTGSSSSVSTGSRTRSNLKSRSSIIRKPFIKKTLTEANNEAEDEEIEIPEDMQEEEKPKKKVIKKSSATKKNEPKIGLEDILNETDNIDDLDLDDDGEELF